MSYSIEQLNCAVETATRDLREALEESLKLQSHYAVLLNCHDGGERRTFTMKSWLARLKELKAQRAAPTVSESPQ